MEIHGMKESTWCAMIHFSQLLGLLIPVLGFAAPIIMWAMTKEQSEHAYEHGRLASNWVISLVIWLAISGSFAVILIGIPFLIAFGILSVVFPLVAGLKALNYEQWKYPLSIEFIKDNRNKLD